jgi:hypothetical protein
MMTLLLILWYSLFANYERVNCSQFANKITKLRCDAKGYQSGCGSQIVEHGVLASLHPRNGDVASNGGHVLVFYHIWLDSTPEHGVSIARINPSDPWYRGEFVLVRSYH